MKPGFVSIAVATLAIAGSTSADEVVRNTYYAKGGGTLIAASRYNWCTADNWSVMGEGGVLVQATDYPHEGDIAIFNKSISYMSYIDGNTMPALWKVDFQVNNTIHQGYINLLAGGEGLKMSSSGDMGWWAGLQFTGTGEVPIDVPAGRTFTNQKGVKGTATFVKTGGGKFRSAGEGANLYQPTITKLQGGSFWIKSSTTPLANGEFIFDSNAAGNLVLENSYTKDNVKTWYNQWVLNNGALRESASVANTTHGISSSDTGARAYLRLTGTPKVAEQRFTGQLYATGGISFEPNAKQAGGEDYVFTIAKSASTAGGGLSVTNGTMRLVEGATFSSLQIVNVGPNATFEVATGSGVRFNCGALDVAAGGKLKLGAGVMLSFGKDSFAAGTRLAEGIYTANGADGTIAVNWIEGDGKVSVSEVAIIDPITLNVESGTVDLDTALAAWNEANGENVTRASLSSGDDSLRTIFKTGAGTLALTNAINGWTGAFYVKQGIVDCGCKYAFGSDVEAKNIIVEDGAAIHETFTTSNYGFNQSQTFTIAGTGPDGNGALWTGSQHISYGTADVFGGYLILSGDAKVMHGPWYYISRKVTLNGHKLTLRGHAANGTFFIDTFKDAGELILENSQERTTTAVVEKPGLVVTVKSGGGWRLWDTVNSGAGLSGMTMTFVENGQFVFDSTSAATASHDSQNNSILWPIAVNSGAKAVCTSQGNNLLATVKFRGPVSGTGKITDSTQACPDYIHLFNTANTLSGGIDINRGVLNVYDPGTLPAACPVYLNGAYAIEMTTAMKLPAPPYYGSAFFSPAAQTLASLTVDGANARRVQGGCGRWTGMVLKKGTSALEYYSGIGGALLEVQGGTVKLPRGPAPGLWEGTNQCADATAVAAAFAGTATPTNLVMRGPHSANALQYENFTTASATKLITYSGYVWNRGDADVIWTLASSVNGPVNVTIDGESVLSASSAALTKAQVTLTPGPHAFTYRSYNGSPRSTNWAGQSGFMYDREGRDGSTTNTYTWCVDPGDGSLFTRSTDSADLPAFDAIHVASGATLDLNGNVYTANDISGAGTVASTAADAMADPKLVMKAMTVDAAVNETLSVAVPVELDANFTVNVTNVANRIRGQRTILTANAPITGKTGGLKTLSDGARFCVAQVSSDGLSIELAPLATMLLIR